MADNETVATPAAEAAAEATGVDIDTVEGTGADGKVTKADVVAADAALTEAENAPKSKKKKAVVAEAVTLTALHHVEHNGTHVNPGEEFSVDDPVKAAEIVDSKAAVPSDHPQRKELLAHADRARSRAMVESGRGGPHPMAVEE